MRRGLIALAAGALAAACASAAMPPGGPEDHEPPKLVKVTPDSDAVNVTVPYATFYFDETINDRGSGAQEIGNYFLVSPSDGLPRINWHRSRIDVRPRHGFRANTAYSITMLPGLNDLRNNAIKAGRRVVFATGATIPPDTITGTVFDWAAERPAAKAFVQGLTPDSLTYLAIADSTGRFTLGPLPPGTYLVRGILDQNTNRGLDRNEAYDSALVVVPQTTPLELRAIARDTLPVRLLTVTVADSVSLRVTFDRPLDPTSPATPAAFRLVGADSTPVPIVAVVTPREEAAQLKAAQQATADSLRRADSLAGKPRPPVAPTPPAAAKPVATPSVPAPTATLRLRLARPLTPVATYRLSATGLRALSGRTQPSERSFTTPKPPPPPSAADSARAAGAKAPRPAPSTTPTPTPAPAPPVAPPGAPPGTPPRTPPARR